MPYFWRQGQSRNEAIGHLSKLPLHLGFRGCNEAPGEVQAKQFRMQHPDVFWEYHFLKLVNGCFCDTKTCNSFWRLIFQNIKYLMHLGKNIYLSQRDLISLFHDIYMKIFLEDLFMGVCTVQMVLKHDWMRHCWKHSNRWFNLHLILDVPQHFCQKLHVWPLITPVM